jgi:hypothetical protein
MTDETELPRCEICGEPMPEGETMFKFHGFSGPCPAPPLPRHAAINWQTSYERALARLATLDAQLESAKRDAERYRWLRDDALQLLVSGPICVAADKWGKPLTQHPGNNSENGPALHITLDGKELDAAIDAARKERTT